MKRWQVALLLLGCLPAASAEPPGVGKAVPPAVQAPAIQSSAATAPATKAPARGKTIDRVELDQTTITGNRELPNVMVIVPWKESAPGSVSPVSRSLLDDALAPLDREEFRRELQYREAVRPSPAAERPSSSQSQSRSTPSPE